MTEPMSEITITIPASAAAQNHIEQLQNTLTKRNQQIESLTQRLEEALTGEPNQIALLAAYKNGWKDAAARLMNVTRNAAQELSKVRKDAFEIYLQGEGKNHGPL